MSKHIDKASFITLPSGISVHPCRLIQRDGTLMWKHALLHQNVLTLPADQATEAHIVKTAQRLEELNSWVSQGLEPWESICVHAWYLPTVPELSKGISVYFKHSIHDTNHTIEKLLPHIQSHETLDLRGNYLYFQRC